MSELPPRVVSVNATLAVPNLMVTVKTGKRDGFGPNHIVILGLRFQDWNSGRVWKGGNRIYAYNGWPQILAPWRGYRVCSSFGNTIGHPRDALRGEKITCILPAARKPLIGR